MKFDMIAKGVLVITIFSLLIVSFGNIITLETEEKPEERSINNMNDIAYINSQNLISELKYNEEIEIEIDDTLYNINFNEKEIGNHEGVNTGSTHMYEGQLNNIQSSYCRFITTDSGYVNGVIDDGDQRYKLLQSNNNDYFNIDVEDTHLSHDDLDANENIDDFHPTTRSTDPITDISNNNDVYYVCRVRVGCDQAWINAYGTGLYFAYYLTAIMDTYDIFLRDFNIYLFISYFHYSNSYITESDDWDWDNPSELIDEFMNYASPQYDDGSQVYESLSLSQVPGSGFFDRAILFTGYGFGIMGTTPGFSSGDFAVVSGRKSTTSTFNFFELAHITAHELGHTFDLGQDYYVNGQKVAPHFEADGLPSGDTESELINGKYPIMHDQLVANTVNEFNWKAKMLVKVKANELKWRLEWYNLARCGSTTTYYNTKLLDFKTFYPLQEGHGPTSPINFNYPLRIYISCTIKNENSFAVNYDQIGFKLKYPSGNEYFHGYSNFNLGAGNDWDFFFNFQWSTGGVEGFNSAYYEIRPFFYEPSGGGWYEAPNPWQTQRFPVFSQNLITSNGPSQDINMRIVYVEVYGPCQPSIGDVLLFKIGYRYIGAPGPYNYIDLGISPHFYLKATDPLQNNEYSETGDMRLKASGTRVYRTWVELDSTGTWSFSPGYHDGVTGTYDLGTPININVI